MKKYQISGDKKLNTKEKILFLSINLFRNIFVLPTIKNVYTYKLEKNDNTNKSPGRKYLDNFVDNTIKDFFADINNKISVLDVGCGSGYIRKILEQNNLFGNYTGVDIVYESRFENFQTTNFISNFVKSEIEKFQTNQKYDLVTSNTSLEHILDDKKAVKIMSSLVKNNGFELHIVPSAWSLPLYLFHGYRQYTLSGLKKLFRGKNYKIFKLGGLGSFFLHLLLITLYERKKGMGKIRNKKIYNKLFNVAIKIDRILPFCPILYAITIKNLKYEKN